MAFQDDYPELAAMFQALQDGLKAVETGYGYDEIWNAGAHLRSASMGLGGYEQIIAAGLRMVADAIDLPPMVEAMREVAETLARPKRPSPCLCGNQPTHKRDACPFEPFDCGGCGSCDRRGDCVTHPEPLGDLRPISIERANALLGINPKDVGLGTGL